MFDDGRKAWTSRIGERCSGLCWPTAVSTAETRPISGMRTRAQRCRRSHFASGRVRTGCARGVQHPRVTAHALARTTDRPNPDDTSQTQTSRMVSCFGHLLVRTGLRIDGQRMFGHTAFPPRPTSWTVTTRWSHRRPVSPVEGIVSVFHSRNPGHARSSDAFGADVAWRMVW